MPIRWPWQQRRNVRLEIPPLRAAALSHVGKVREKNEDACVALPERGVFVVSDGIGGQPGGDVASKIVVEVLPGLLEERLEAAQPEDLDDVTHVVREAVVDLSTQVQQQAADQPGLSGMGATLVAALVLDDHVAIASLGDSRVYRYRHPTLVQLTADHSIVGILLRGGEITPEEVEDHPAKGRVSRFVGMQGEVLPDVVTVDLAPGDRLLLCSDGLSGQVDDDAMAEILACEPSCEEACKRLIEAALDAGGPDNITALVADRKEEPAAREGVGNAGTELNEELSEGFTKQLDQKATKEPDEESSGAQKDDLSEEPTKE